ncbi:MAG: C40 family peptidase [Comamonadaceae bacterium]|nr:C40 family peptidase [Comamonadaceae bacterium]
MIFRHCPLPAALLMAALLSPWTAHADVAPRDVLGQFLLKQQLSSKPLLRGFGQRVAVARHKAASKGQAQLARGPGPAVPWPGQPAPQASNRPRIDTHTLMMSDVVVTAMGYLGKPYSYGQSSLQGGFDCSGFVLSLFQRTLGHTLPRTAAEQARATQAIAKKELRPGDLVFFNTMRRQFSHVGIYIGEGRFIHSPRAGSRIRVESMEKAYWQSRFNGARRIALGSTQLASAR